MWNIVFQRNQTMRHNYEIYFDSNMKENCIKLLPKEEHTVFRNHKTGISFGISGLHLYTAFNLQLGEKDFRAKL
jgi:hypothetical protein